MAIDGDLLVIPINPERGSYRKPRDRSFFFFFFSSPLIQVAGLVTRTLLHKDSIDQFVEFRIWRGKPYWRLESRLPRRTGDKEMSRYRSWYGIVKSSIDLSTAKRAVLNLILRETNHVGIKLLSIRFNCLQRRNCAARHV